MKKIFVSALLTISISAVANAGMNGEIPPGCKAMDLDAKYTCTPIGNTDAPGSVQFANGKVIISTPDASKVISGPGYDCTAKADATAQRAGVIVIGAELSGLEGDSQEGAIEILPLAQPGQALMAFVEDGQPSLSNFQSNTIYCTKK